MRLELGALRFSFALISVGSLEPPYEGHCVKPVARRAPYEGHCVKPVARECDSATRIRGTGKRTLPARGEAAPARRTGPGRSTSKPGRSHARPSTGFER